MVTMPILTIHVLQLHLFYDACARRDYIERGVTCDV